MPRKSPVYLLGFFVTLKDFVINQERKTKTTEKLKEEKHEKSFNQRAQLH